MNLRQYILEAKDQLDISIQAANKWLTSEKKKEEFLTSKVKIEAKTDGIKLTVVKIDNTGTINDYIFSYKGNVLYPTEYDYTSLVKAKKESVGTSQFKIVFAHFSKLGKNSIPLNTEFFIEYLMKKNTLSSNYKRPHGMVLIAASKCTYEVKFGKLKTKSTFDTSKRNEYAKMLKLNTPLFIFEGILGNAKSFENGIKVKALKDIYSEYKNGIDWDNYDNIISNISEMLLKIESAFGGVEEGCVISFNDKILKFQQSYQVDQAARLAIKNKTRDTPENETIYWNNVKLASNELIKLIPKKLLTEAKLPEALKELSFELKKYKLNFEHKFKTEVNIKDDIQLTTKTMIIKSLKGNNNALFFGKYRILSRSHYNIIKRGLSLYDDVVVGLITSGDTKETKDIREKMLKLCFPNIDIIHNTNGNIIRLIQKSPKNINIVIAGTDRAQAYRDQLSKSDIQVKEIPRINDDISASKIIANINDYEYFTKNTPKQIHNMYNELLKVYGM